MNVDGIMEKHVEEQLKKYEPAILSPNAIAAVLITSRKMNTRLMAMLCAQELMTKAAYKKSVRNARSNNWLKMHGYPLRRKAR